MIGQVNRRRGSPGNRRRSCAKRRDVRRLEKRLRTASGRGYRWSPIYSRGRGQRDRERQNCVRCSRNFQNLVCRSAGRRMDRHCDPSRRRAFRHLRVALVRDQFDGAFGRPGFNMDGNAWTTLSSRRSSSRSTLGSSCDAGSTPKVPASDSGVTFDGWRWVLDMGSPPKESGFSSRTRSDAKPRSQIGNKVRWVSRITRYPSLEIGKS